MTSGKARAGGARASSPDHSGNPPPSDRKNRLAREVSPYLLQHQHNPVDWFPWGPEAFSRAEREDKPIFLSVGYATCHWCHVMERESFENEAVAALLNRYFVSIKVDREERPDVDHLYMQFVQATTGHGGWPLSVFLTPDRLPFYGGTYFPPKSRYGMPAFPDVLEHVRRAWQDRRREILESAASIHQSLSQAGHGREPEAEIAVALLRKAARRIKTSFDEVNGGFGDAPKFPQPGLSDFLLRTAALLEDRDAIRMALTTCDAMAAGGIHDHVGGGFARYATDAAWRIPHFEKMLYDNAQLARLFLDAYRIGGQPRHAAVARDILDYVLRDMTHPDGGFFSAEDADSEGIEGKFYTWSLADVEQVLDGEERRLVLRRFGVTAGGNFVDHSAPDAVPGQNVLYLADARLAPQEAPLLEGALARMREARSRRVRPLRDDKILASWNGLMLGAFAEAGAILDYEPYRTAARRNADFMKACLWDPGAGTLHSRWRDGKRDEVQLLSAYALALSGVVTLYETDLSAGTLEFAVRLAESMLDRFHDTEHGGFWQTCRNAPDLIRRVKDDHDGPEPSGNSAATLALLKLAEITGREDFGAAAAATLRHYGGRLDGVPEAMPNLLCAAAFALGTRRRVVVAGDREAPGFRGLLDAAHAVYCPGKVVLGTDGPVDAFTRSLARSDSAPLAYVCTGTVCGEPTADPAELRRLLT